MVKNRNNTIGLFLTNKTKKKKIITEQINQTICTGIMFLTSGSNCCLITINNKGAIILPKGRTTKGNDERFINLITLIAISVETSGLLSKYF